MLTVRPFEPSDQDAARALVLAGLGEHFGCVDLEINGDLKDIAASYAGELFLVAVADGLVVGTGALIREGEGIARVVRMSVRREWRRRGIASAVLERLVEHARARGYWRVVIETGDWEDSVGFYSSTGFVQTSHDGAGPNMALDL